MPTLNYSVPTPPSNMSLKARLAYAYLFYEDSDWHCVRTTTDHRIVVIGNNLNDAEICPDEESFIAWLEQIAEENLEDDPKEFISALFVSHGVRIDDLIDDEVAEAIRKRVLCAPAPALAPAPVPAAESTVHEILDDVEELSVETSAVETISDAEEDDEDD